MADYTWPFSDSDARYLCEAFDEALEFNVELSVSRSGKVSTLSLPGARWRATMQFPDTGLSELVTRRQIEAFLASLRGGADRLLLHNLLTPQPLGTMSGSVTLAASVSAGATTANITGGAPAAGKTLLRGDRVAFGGQRVMLTADATANGSGAATITFQPAHRAGASSGSAVTLVRPTTKYVLTQPVVQMPARGSVLPGFAVDLIEDSDQVSTGADPYFANVVLLLHMDGANNSTTFVDSAMSKAITVGGNTKISTAQSKFGGAAADFDGSGDYLQVNYSTDFNISSGDWTIEAWVYPRTLSGSGLVGRRGPYAEGWVFQISSLRAVINGSWSDTQMTWTTPSMGVWSHLALVRSGSSIMAFVNGTLLATKTGVSTIEDLTGQNPFIGMAANGGESVFDGFIDDFRWTKGVARYTANFTPPTAAFTNY